MIADAAPVAAREAPAAAHPRGLWYLAFTEAWERFSYYGMSALLVLYMIDQLLLPGHVEHIAGFAAFRHGIESVTGPLSTQALASQVFGLYSGFVYFTPMLGGMIADRWIGQRNAVVIGALAMSGGHLAMGFDQSFLLALALLIVGSGFLKGNITAQVGLLYAPDDEARRTRGYILFSMAINIGAILGPLACGLLAQRYGWHYGFGVAAIFMLAGLATYLLGCRHLPARAARRTQVRTKLTAAEWRVVAALLAMMLISVFQSTSYYQLFNVNPVWIKEHVALDVRGFRIPIPWYQSLSSVASVAGVPVLFWLWRLQARHGGEPGELAKIGIGAWLAAASNLVLVVAMQVSAGGPVHWLWPLVYAAGHGFAFIWYWPTLLALVSRAAPAPVKATLMGIVFLSFFASNNLIGWLGGFYEPLGPSNFWLLHAAIGAGGGVAVLLFGRVLGAILQERRS